METVNFTLDGQALTASPEETILQAAERIGIAIPRLCYKEGYRPDGNCRACVVEISGERALAPSCCRYPVQEMDVKSDSDRARHSQRMVLEMLLADMPQQSDSPYTTGSELDFWSKKLSVGRPRFPSRDQPPHDLSNPAIAVNLDACIQCTRCIRACREEQVNDVIGYAFRGKHAKIVFDFSDEMGASSCVSCGECVQACPTGALMPAQAGASAVPERQVDSACPYCGVGCLLTYNITGERIQSVQGRDGPANESRLCVKGRYGYDYTHHPQRLTTPLVRRTGIEKSAELIPAEKMLEHFRIATWDEALSFATGGLSRLKSQHGRSSLAGFGSAKCSNEEAYLFQKLIRTGFGNNNVDHCTRLCHASSVAALMETIGSGAVSNQVSDVTEAEVILLIGARPTVNHPVAATFMKNAVQNGKTLIYMDPYKSDLSRHATHFLQFRPDTDVPMLNALMYVIIEEDLHNRQYIDQYTEGFEALRDTVKGYSPENVAPICGIPADTLRNVARIYATSKGSMIFWGMGISQHIHGTDNARCLISLALLTGQIGKPGTGLHPLRGQNNVQGASDMGLIPMVFPDYQSVASDAAQQRFESLWDSQLDPKPGLTVIEIMHAIHDGTVKGMYIMGENPAMSDPNLNHARLALSELEHLVVQDIFFTETAGYADVILPASAFAEKTGTFTNTDRRVQLGRQALNPPGQARQDWEILKDMAAGMGLDWDYTSVRDVFAEIRKATPSMAGITWERLEQEHSVTYPCENEGDPGVPILFQDGFPTASGRGKFVPAEYIKAAELPDEKYPFVFTTGRQLEHWHTGSMTRKATVLAAIEPEPVASINPTDLARLKIQPGDMLALRSRRGKLEVLARADDGVQAGTVFMPFCYHEAAANLLTNEEIDPYGKIPEFKYCAISISPADATAPA
jgi:formate dehydrogenase major subunit